MPEFNLATVWALLIAFAVFAYVVLDGFDLGIGILFPFISVGRERDTAMNSITPVWDGNETWLVLGGAGLFAAFPLAYSLVLTALYAPVMAMLLGLVLRGVAFEFRWRGQRSRFVWDIAFAAGSLIAALAQGIMLGALVQGVKVEGRVYAGGWFDWLTPFSVMTAIALAIGYALLGATWLIMKTHGDIQARVYRYGAALTGLFMATIFIVSVWTPFIDPRYWARWFSWPFILYTAPVPLFTLAAAAMLVRSLQARRQWQPFVATLIVFALCYVGLGIGLFPQIVPPDISIQDAAAPDSSLAFLLWGAAVLIPMILAYTAHSYWVFRGKVDPEEAYH